MSYNQQSAGGYPPPYSEAPKYPPNPSYPPNPNQPSIGFQPQSDYNPGYAGYPSAPQTQQHHGGGYPPPQPQFGGGYPAPQGYAPPPQGYPQPGGYISQQPTAQGGPTSGWMNIPQGRPANCPPGLEYLTTVDQLMVKQKVELLEALIGWETNNKFTVKNVQGQKVFLAVEINDCCTRNCCGPLRPFEMKVLDNYKNEVIHFERPLACSSCWFPCCLQTLNVFSPPGALIGSIEQEWTLLTPQFNIKNGAGDIVLRIEGPICRFTMCGGDVNFKILSRDGLTEVGRISKQWSGLLREAFTDADYFGISFPMDLDVRMKAVMLGACFLIDAMFFEKSGNRESDGLGML
ncbi:hypothetical protein WDU94_004837 [Cyamophila willieti]